MKEFQSHNQLGDGRAARRGGRNRIPAIVFALTASLLIVASGPLQAGRAGAKGGKTYKLDMTKCGGFTAADAAKILNVPAASLTPKSEELYETFWVCSFTPKIGKGLSFSVSINKSEAEAIENMQQLRSHLEIAGGTAPFKDKAVKGAYSEISGLGDDAVWTNVNGTLNVRKGNIVIQVQAPEGKTEQIKVAQAFLAKF